MFTFFFVVDFDNYTFSLFFFQVNSRFLPMSSESQTSYNDVALKRELDYILKTAEEPIKVKVVIEGSAGKKTEDGKEVYRATGTATLITCGDFSILVDCGNPHSPIVPGRILTLLLFIFSVVFCSWHCNDHSLAHWSFWSSLWLHWSWNRWFHCHFPSLPFKDQTSFLGDGLLRGDRVYQRPFEKRHDFDNQGIWK